MSKFVRKAALDRYPEVAGGHSDPACTHVILTEAEYSKLLRKISDAEQEVRITKDNAGKEIRRAQGEAQRRIEAAEHEAAQKVAAMGKELAAEKKESEYQRGLNVTLLRISKERANADRKLERKKEHSGYVVTYSAEKECRYKIDRRSWGRALLWETVLQSPYSAEFTGEQAKRQIWEDLFAVYGDEAWKIGRLGIDEEYDGKYEALIDEPEWAVWYATKNVLLMPEVKLRLNFNVSFWEIVIQHTQPLGVVPPDMRARQK